MDVTLSELIEQVREELLTPRQMNAPDARYPFLFVDEIELEIDVTVSKKADGSGKVSIKVVEVGGGIEKSTESTHRIKVKMTPLLTKEEVRGKLGQDAELWAKIEPIAMQAVTKESGMVGEE
jgi:hypothetical protein